ncbi:DUF397 domain-containing protein [Streptomyces niveus]|uniref:DUF397 domain-containing protein n=1 Tax=Streptomyces niveus TaxID=193462 RepID=UPI0036F04B3A
MTVGHHGQPAGLVWFKSSYSGSGGGDCVEVAVATEAVHVRDSKGRPGPRLAFNAVAWTDFLEFAAER